MNINKQKGFTLIELMIVLFVLAIIIGIIGGGFYKFFANNMALTQQRAEKNALLFLNKNNLQSKVFTCAGDSNHDGYGTCSITLIDNTKYQLECSSDWYNVSILGDTSCKEKSLININQ